MLQCREHTPWLDRNLMNSRAESIEFDSLRDCTEQQDHISHSLLNTNSNIPLALNWGMMHTSSRRMDSSQIGNALMMTRHEEKCRVVVTGMGVVSPIGCGIEKFWDSLCNKQHGIAYWNSSGIPGGMCAGELKDFRGTVEDYGPLSRPQKKKIAKSLKQMNRETMMGVLSAHEAIQHSDLNSGCFQPHEIGVCYGADNVSLMPDDFIDGVQVCKNDEGEFDPELWGSMGLDRVTPLWILKCLPNMPACYIAIFNDFRGPNNSITERDCSANLAIAEAAQMIAHGEVKAMIAGATGTSLLPQNYLHTRLDMPIAPEGSDPCTVYRPFDRLRSGTVVAEGAATLVLEERSCAIQRGATIYGEILGGFSSYVGKTSRTGESDPRQSLLNAMTMTLQQSQLEIEDLGHIHAHAASSPLEDIYEAHAIRTFLGKYNSEIPVIAAKPYTGNASAGSGAMEIVASLLAVHHQSLFPVLNFEEPDPECPIEPLTSFATQVKPRFMNVNLMSKGQASCLLVHGA